MIQKKMWMRFLIFGISLTIVLYSSCTTFVDYSVKAKWIYINETGHNITYNPLYDSIFNVAPHDTTIYLEDGDGPKNITALDYIPPINYAVIFYDNIKCDTLNRGSKPNLGDGPLGIANYTSKKLGTNNFEFTYRFTEKQYTDAKICK